MDKHIFQWFRWWKGDKVDGATQKKCWKYQNRIPTYYGHNYKVAKEAFSTTYTRCCSRSGRIIFGNYDKLVLPSINQTSITYDTEDTFDALGMFPIYQEY